MSLRNSSTQFKVESATDNTSFKVSMIPEAVTSPKALVKTKSRLSMEEAIEIAETFTCFPKLPAEIRIKIWQFTLPGPRLVKITQRFGARVDYRQKQQRHSRFISSCPPPVSLRVCRESRYEALKEYELAFPTKTSPPQIYLNFAIDQLVLGNPSAWFPRTTLKDPAKLMKKKSVTLYNEIRKVRSIVLDEQFTWSGRLMSKTNFINLSNVGIVIRNINTKTEKRGFYKIESREFPTMPEVSHDRIDWINKWVQNMDQLAIEGGPNHEPKLKLDFYNLITGSAKDEVKEGKGETSRDKGSQTHCEAEDLEQKAE